MTNAVFFYKGSADKKITSSALPPLKDIQQVPRFAQFSLILTLIHTPSKILKSMHIPGKAQLAYLKPFQIAACLYATSLDKHG